jgi:hypothetical protein
MAETNSREGIATPVLYSKKNFKFFRKINNAQS